MWGKLALTSCLIGRIQQFLSGEAVSHFQGEQHNVVLRLAPSESVDFINEMFQKRHPGEPSMFLGHLSQSRRLEKPAVGVRDLDRPFRVEQDAIAGFEGDFDVSPLWRS